jgi:hypothetical protein
MTGTLQTRWGQLKGNGLGHVGPVTYVFGVGKLEAVRSRQ